MKNSHCLSTHTNFKLNSLRIYFTSSTKQVLKHTHQAVLYLEYTIYIHRALFNLLCRNTPFYTGKPDLRACNIPHCTNSSLILRVKYALARAKQRDYEMRNISPCSWRLLGGFVVGFLPRQTATEYFAGDNNSLTTPKVPPQ